MIILVVRGLHRVRRPRPPYLKGGKTIAPHEDLFFSQEGMGGVRPGPWKLVPPNGGASQLFDVSKVVEEKRDLAAGESARVKELTAKWQAWNAQMPLPAKGGKGGKPNAPQTDAENSL